MILRKHFLLINDKNTIVLLILSLFSTAVCSQQPHYTAKKIVRFLDSTEFKGSYPVTAGPLKTYIAAHPQLWDLDDGRTTFIRTNGEALLCFEGQKKNGKREGLFNVFVIDSANHLKRYKIWEQNYMDDKLNGRWYNYTLAGTLAFFQTFKNDTMNGLTRYFEIDGKTIRGEEEYFKSPDRYLKRSFFPNGKMKEEIPFENGQTTGIGKKYYENGTLMDEVQLVHGEMHGTRKYYYPNGQLWIEQVYKKDKSWDIISNYTETGKKREPGTLRNGNGTIIFYTEDGSIRETATFLNGESKK